jgi:AraC-like DNA-binding protein
VDAIAGLLDGPRARGAFLLRVELDPPWAMRIEDEAPLSLVAVTRGDALVMADAGAPRRVRAGDVMVALGPTPYALADDPATPIQVIIRPGPTCVSVTGERLDEPLHPEAGAWRTRSHGYSAVRTWGNTVEGDTELLVGTYRMRSAVGQRLTSALPTLAVLPGFAERSSLFGLLGEEIAKDDPGQDVVLDRLLDLLLVDALRAWFASPESAAPRWYRARDDPAIGPALRLLVDNPSHAWTVASLAAAARMSRAAFARRFTELVGEPPMTFLAGWRLAMAADLLRDTDATLDTVARNVGYSSPFALSTAFKRVHGVSPQQHRQAAHAAAP